MMNRPDWQALLFVPVGADRHLASSIRHRPDAVVLDLEDAVAPLAKDAARGVLRANQAALAAAGIDCVLRVNGPIRAMVDDLDAADHALLHGVMVPKCEDAHPLRNVAEVTGGAIGLIALVESPAGVQRLAEIAAVPQVVALMLGSEDYSAALGVDPDRAVLTIASRVLIGSGCTPLVAQSVAEAVNQLKGNAKAVTKVLLDLNLPAPGSAALYDRLKELRPDLTIVLTSHQPEGKAREAIAQANESGFLRKPWRPEELIRRVR